jgi:phosphoribosylformylglycinamidine cyclo-ligase
MPLGHRSTQQTYRAAGVNLKAADEIVRRIRQSARSTFSKQVLSEIGSFGAFYSAAFKEYEHPVLVSSIDGVGTKLKIAAKVGRHDTIGEDLVNHCVNDILVCGARPLFFLDYIGAGKLSQAVIGAVLHGIVKACKENQCSLVGGETAEMPGLYHGGDYDVVGAIVGVAEKGDLLDGGRVRAGDHLLALPSTGLHTNGYSLARKVLLGKYHINDFHKELGTTIGAALLATHRSYLKPIGTLQKSIVVHAMSHITGGGIVGNTTRVVPARLSLKVDWRSWRRPAIFDLIQRIGNVSEREMRRVFNLGVGIVIILGQEDSSRAIALLRKTGERPFIIGCVERRQQSSRRGFLC